MNEPPHNSLSAELVPLTPRLRLAGKVCSAYAVAVGLWALGWWFAGWPAGMLPHPADWPLAPKCAVLFVLLGSALGLNLFLQAAARRRRLAGGFALAALVIALWGLAEAVLPVGVSLERRVFGGSLDANMQAVLRPNALRMAVDVVLSALTVTLTAWPRGGLGRITGWVAAALAAAHLATFVAVLYRVGVVVEALPAPASFLATTGALALALALLASTGSERPPLSYFWQSSNRAHLLRVFVSVTTLLALLSGLLAEFLGSRWLNESSSLHSLRVLLPVAVVFAAGVLLARHVGRQLDTAEAQLIAARDDLEDRVRQRTAELTRANKELQDEIASRALAEAAYQESLANFTALGDLVPALVLLHRNGKCVYANQVAADIVGCSRAELIGRDVVEMIHPDHRAAVMDRVLQPQAERGGVRREFALQASNGEARWVDSVAQFIQLRKQPVVMICALDISERKQAERRLVASEERFRQVVENIREVFWMTDPSKQEFVYISNAYEAIWGRTRDNAYTLPSGWLENVHPEDRERVRNALMTLHATGRYEEIYRIVRPDGLVRWIQDRAFPILNERGEVHRVAGIAEDITAWKATEESLRSSEERFRSLFEAAPIGIALLGPDGHYLRINRVYCEMVGYSEVELLRLGTRRVTHPEDIAQGQRYYKELVAGTRDHYSREKRLITSGGRQMQALSASSAVRDRAGKLRYIVSMLLDITERKRLQNEVLEISSQERRRIGHDLHDGLGQYLSGIAFKTKCLEETLQAEAPGYEPAAQELVRLLNNAVSQARALARGLDPVEAEVGGLVPAMHNLASESGKLFSVECQFESDQHEFALDTGVALHLFRIAQEAITNAARHGGARRIQVRLTQEPEGIRLRIEDNGKGFAVDPLPDSGMGLRTMQYRADTIGASFRIRSSRAEGTCVECLLPTPARSETAKPKAPQ